MTKAARSLGDDAHAGRADLGQEARRLARPREGEVRAGAGDADVEQPALLGDLLVGLGLADGQHALLHRGQEDGVPLEPLGPVVGEQVDADALCRVLCGVAAVEVGQQVRGAGGGVRGDQVTGDGQQQVERRGSFAGLLPDRVGTRLVAQAPDEQVAQRIDSAAPVCSRCARPSSCRASRTSPRW